MQFIHDNLGTAAIVEQFIDGRELYVGVIGNERLDVFPVWEMSFAKMPENRWHIATERVKWSTQYQKKHGIMTDAARLDGAVDRTHPAHREAHLSRARPERLRPHRPAAGRAGPTFVLEANPNPNLAYGEDFAESAEISGLSYEPLLDRILALGLRWVPERTG